MRDHLLQQHLRMPLARLPGITALSCMNEPDEDFAADDGQGTDINPLEVRNESGHKLCASLHDQLSDVGASIG